MNDANARQQIVDKIKDSSNILVTVSKNPSVDELSAALGLTILLNKLKKHATAVFSGAIPPAIEFLDPEKTFEGTVDSLRDFIIALDKEKADHLRYKVDGDVVKIFITPYRTTITSEDLDFSQGDYNVEMVIGLGVRSQDELDQALSAHGRILHDAMVATVTVGDTKSELGSVDWHEQNASSLSELLVGLVEPLKSDKPLLDEQIATAFLTGIVAATDRFSNNRTTSKAMTISAQLMSAGANQQLIASKLEEAHEIGGSANSGSDGTTELTEGESTKVAKEKPVSKKGKGEAKQDDGSLTISHEKQGTVDEVASATEAENQAAAAKAAQAELTKQTQEVPKAQQTAAAEVAEKKLAEQLASVAPLAAATPSVADLQKDLAAVSAEVDQAAQAPPPLNGALAADQWQTDDQQPAMGGTLNATTEQAADDKRRALEEDRNKTILTHGGTGGYIPTNTAPSFQSPLNSVTQPEYESPMVDPFSQATSPSSADTAPTAYAPPLQPPSQTLADLDAQNRTPHEEARNAIDAAFNAAPEPQPTVAPLPGLPPVQTPFATPAPLDSSFSSQLQTVSQEQPPVAPSFEQSSASTVPQLPPMPDFSNLPPLPPGLEGPQSQPSGALPPEKLEEVLGSAPPPAASQPNDPGQFKIPGQG